MNLSLSAPAHSSWHQSPRIMQFTHTSPCTLSENLPLQYVHMTSPVLLPFSSIASAWILADLESLFTFFKASLFSVCQAETIFFSLNILLIFSYTENKLTFQLNFLAGLSLIFCFLKLVQAIYLQSI